MRQSFPELALFTFFLALPLLRSTRASVGARRALTGQVGPAWNVVAGAESDIMKRAMAEPGPFTAAADSSTAKPRG